MVSDKNKKKEEKHKPDYALMYFALDIQLMLLNKIN